MPVLLSTGRCWEEPSNHNWYAIVVSPTMYAIAVSPTMPSVYKALARGREGRREGKKGKRKGKARGKYYKWKKKEIK